MADFGEFSFLEYDQIIPFLILYMTLLCNQFLLFFCSSVKLCLPSFCFLNILALIRILIWDALSNGHFLGMLNYTDSVKNLHTVRVYNLNPTNNYWLLFIFLNFFLQWTFFFFESNVLVNHLGRKTHENVLAASFSEEIDIKRLTSVTF